MGWRRQLKKQVVLKCSLLHKSDKTTSTPKLLDTSVIIDGRIKELCNTGFIEGPLMVPPFCIE